MWTFKSVKPPQKANQEAISCDTLTSKIACVFPWHHFYYRIYALSDREIACKLTPRWRRSDQSTSGGCSRSVAPPRCSEAARSPRARCRTRARLAPTRFLRLPPLRDHRHWRQCVPVPYHGLFWGEIVLKNFKQRIEIRWGADWHAVRKWRGREGKKRQRSKVIPLVVGTTQQKLKENSLQILIQKSGRKKRFSFWQLTSTGFSKAPYYLKKSE